MDPLHVDCEAQRRILILDVVSDLLRAKRDFVGRLLTPPSVEPG